MKMSIDVLREIERNALVQLIRETDRGDKAMMGGGGAMASDDDVMMGGGERRRGDEATRRRWAAASGDGRWWRWRTGGESKAKRNRIRGLLDCLLVHGLGNGS